jgi:hypothetical protein
MSVKIAIAGKRAAVPASNVRETSSSFAIPE